MAREARIKKLASELSSFINSASNEDIELMAKEITDDHRTLQQSMARLIVKCLQQWSSDHVNGYYDMRNEATVVLAHKICSDKELGEFYLPYI